MGKYEKPSVVTNDIFCAAYLVSTGSTLECLIHNRRNRISFVVTGDEVEQFRDRYKSGSVFCNVHSLRDSVTLLRQMMNEKRSNPCPKSPNQLSRA